MGSIQLYTQPNKRGLQTYETGTFSTTDLDKGTDYTEGYLKQIEIQSINKTCWFTKLTLRTGALSQLDMTHATSLLPQVNMEAYDMGGGVYYYKPTNCDPQATALATRPLDWDIHWRDKYTAEPTLYTTTSQPVRQFYANQPLSAPTSGGIPSERAFVEDTYYETNQGRYLFWTLSDCYFAIEGTWQASLGGFGTACTNSIIAFNAGMGSTNASTRAAARYVNCLRERGYLGPMINLGTEAEFHNFCSYSSTTVTPDVQETRALAGFVQFSYPITLESEEVINVDMMGICVYRVTADGYISEAQISAISENFWEEKPPVPYTGPTSHVQGGGGAFSHNPGTRDVDDVKTQIKDWNDDVLQGAYSGYNKYVMNAGHAAFTEFCQNLRTPGFIDSLKNIYLSPLDNVICCHMIPSSLAPAFNGYYSPILAGSAIMSTITAPKFDQISTTSDTYSVDISENAGDFSDYSNTSVYIHLPFIGVQQLDTTACMNGQIKVFYNCDVISGDVTAFVGVTDRDGSKEVRYTYKGNLSCTIPMKTYVPLGISLGLAAAKSALAVGGGAIAGGLTGALSGGLMAGSIASGLEHYGAQGLFNDPESINYQNLARSLTPGAGFSALQGAVGAAGRIGSNFGQALTAGSQTTGSTGDSGTVTSAVDTSIWVLVVKPCQSNPDYYGAQNGFTSDLGFRVRQAIGLLAVNTVDLTGLTCTDSERSEIENFLKSGVYVSDPYETTIG